MRLLITGGAGTLGRHVVKHFGERAESIHVIDNFSTSIRDSLDPPPGVSIQEGDIGRLSDLEEAFSVSQPTHVIHLAASYKNPDDWQGDIQTNTIGTALVAQLSQSAKCERLINVQTVLCYGLPDALPIPVTAPLRPKTSYAISKTAGEQYLVNSGLSFASLRLGNVVCPGLSIGPIPSFYAKLKAGETCTVTESSRDFVDIQDFLAALDKVMDATAPSGIFNVSTGMSTSMRQIYNVIARYLGSSSPVFTQTIGPDDIPEIVLDPSQTRLTLGWEAAVSLEDSLQKCLKSYDACGVGQIYSHLRDQGAR